MACARDVNSWRGGALRDRDPRRYCRPSDGQSDGPVGNGHRQPGQFAPIGNRRAGYHPVVMALRATKDNGNQLWGGQSWPQPASEELPRKLLITINWREMRKMQFGGGVPLPYGPAPRGRFAFSRLWPPERRLRAGLPALQTLQVVFDGAPQAANWPLLAIKAQVNGSKAVSCLTTV
jgi:hypothetical protein